MSLTATMLGLSKPFIPHGTPTVYLAEEYRDIRRFPKIEPKLTEKQAQEVKPACYEHMLNTKAANIEAMLACVRAGIRTQPAIRRATNISLGTISIRMAMLVKNGEIEVNRNVCPWSYTISRKSKQ